MATLTVESISESGLDATYNSAEAGGDTFQNDSSARTFIHVKNGDASSHTVTVAPVQDTLKVSGYGDLTKETVSVAVPASEDRFIGPFPLTAFGANPDIQYDAVTSVTIAVLKAD